MKTLVNPPGRGNPRKRSEITDAIVVVACWSSHNSRGDLGNSLDVLRGMTGAGQKVAFAAMERAAERGLVEYGVSLRTAWPTEKGFALQGRDKSE